MRYALLIVMVLHGLIHLMGFAKAFGYVELSQLKQPIPAPMGLLWLLACLGLLTAGGLYFAKSDIWPWVALAAVVISQGLIAMTWSDAKFGTAANLIILVPALLALL